MLVTLTVAASWANGSGTADGKGVRRNAVAAVEAVIGLDESVGYEEDAAVGVPQEEVIAVPAGHDTQVRHNLLCLFRLLCGLGLDWLGWRRFLGNGAAREPCRQGDGCESDRMRVRSAVKKHVLAPSRR